MATRGDSSRAVLSGQQGQPDSPLDPDMLRQLRRTAVRLLSRREYSAHELRNRLKSGSPWARRKSGHEPKRHKARQIEPPQTEPPQTEPPQNNPSCEPTANARQGASQSDLAAGSAPDLVPDPIPDPVNDFAAELATLQPATARVPTAAEVDFIIDEMQTLDLQSDHRFAESLVRRRAQRQGVSQIARMLSNHQIDPVTTDALLGQLRQSELDRAAQVWSRRFGQVAEDLREKSRQSRFLSNRGFSPDVIARVLRGDTSDCSR